MGDVNHEPSMEEILASIKRIIAEDGEGAPPAVRRGRDRRAIAPTAEVPATDESDDGVLELTHRLDPEGASDSAERIEKATAPAAEEAVEPVVADDVPESAEEAHVSDDGTTTGRPTLEATEPPLVSAPVREASRQSIAALSAMIVKPEANGPDTLEGLVREMLRPMLKDWLDAKLPGLVEQVVQREIAKIVDQRG